MSDVESIIVSREVQVELSASELATKRARVAVLRSRIEDLDAQKKESKAELEGLEEAIIKGGELRSMPCREEKNFSNGEKRIIREDTGETIETAILSGEERQKMMNIDAPTVPGTGRKKKMGAKGNGAKPDEPAGDGEPSTGANPEAH